MIFEPQQKGLFTFYREQAQLEQYIARQKKQIKLKKQLSQIQPNQKQKQSQRHSIQSNQSIASRKQQKLNIPKNKQYSKQKQQLKEPKDHSIIIVKSGCKKIQKSTNEKKPLSMIIFNSKLQQSNKQFSIPKNQYGFKKNSRDQQILGIHQNVIQYQQSSQLLMNGKIVIKYPKQFKSSHKKRQQYQLNHNFKDIKLNQKIQNMVLKLPTLSHNNLKRQIIKSSRQRDRGYEINEIYNTSEILSHRNIEVFEKQYSNNNYKRSESIQSYRQKGLKSILYKHNPQIQRLRINEHNKLAQILARFKISPK